MQIHYRRRSPSAARLEMVIYEQAAYKTHASVGRILRTKKTDEHECKMKCRETTGNKISDTDTN